MQSARQGFSFINKTSVVENIPYNDSVTITLSTAGLCVQLCLLLSTYKFICQQLKSPLFGGSKNTPVEYILSQQKHSWFPSCALSCKLTTNKKFPRFGNLGSFPSSAQEFPRKCAKVYKVSKSVQNDTLLEMNQFFAVYTAYSLSLNASMQCIQPVTQTVKFVLIVKQMEAFSHEYCISVDHALLTKVKLAESVQCSIAVCTVH